MIFVLKAIAAFFASMGFAIMFNLPKKLIVYSGFAGALGFFAYQFFNARLGGDYILPYLLGSVVIGIFGEIFASITKNPSTVFTIPGIIPIVPGYSIYYTMFYLVQNDTALSIKFGTEAILISVSIACGIAISSTFMRRVRPHLDKLIRRVIPKR